MLGGDLGGSFHVADACVLPLILGTARRRGVGMVESASFEFIRSLSTHSYATHTLRYRCHKLNISTALR